MVDIKHWIEVFTKKMEETFSERIWFIGLQGSYGCNEANASSDIDMVVILDELHTEDYSLAILSGSPKSFHFCIRIIRTLLG